MRLVHDAFSIVQQRCTKKEKVMRGAEEQKAVNLKERQGIVAKYSNTIVEFEVVE